MALEDNVQITIVAPDDHPLVPLFKMENSGPFFSPEGSPSANGSASSGYSLPDTPPEHNPGMLDISSLGAAAFTQEEYHDALSTLSTPIHAYSPSSLSPSFGGLSLGDGLGHSETLAMFNTFENKNLALGPDYGLVPSDPMQPAPFQSLSPLILPQHQTLELLSQDSWNTPVDDELLSLFNDASPLMFAANPSYPSLADPLPTHHRSPPHLNTHHTRHRSEMGTPWTGSSFSSEASVTSPSLILTPSEPSSSAGIYDSGISLHSLDDAFSTVTVTRRHSHSGARGTSVGPDRGRAEGRSPTSTANSSRRTSPYPHVRPNASPVAQVYEADNLLAVPPAEEGLRRRHSFTFGGRPTVMTANPAALDGPYSQEPTTPTSGRKIASQAGLKASEARRTKEAKFICDMCDQTFTTNHNLKNHKNVHLGVKEHVCTHCNRSFTTQSVLARHLKTCKAVTAGNQRQPSS